MSAASVPEELQIDWDHVLTPDNAFDEDHVSVDGGEMAWGETGELRASGLRECFGIAVYDHSSGDGYMAHWATQEESLEEFVEALLEFGSAITAYGVDCESADAMMAGLNYEAEVSENFMDESAELDEIARAGAKKAIAEKYVEQKFSETEVCWDMEPGYTAEIRMDLDNEVIMYNGRFQSDKELV